MKAPALLVLLAVPAAFAAADAPPPAPEPYIEVNGVPVPLPPSGEDVPAAVPVEEIERIARIAMGVGTNVVLRSSDDGVRVLAPDLPPADRAVLLGFATDLRDALEAKLGVRGASPDEARHASFRTDDCRLLVSCVADAAGTNAPARIETRFDPHRPGRSWQIPLVATVSNPENGLDPHVLAERIVRGWIDLKVLTLAWSAAGAGRPAAAGPTPFPAWFGTGLARSLDPATRQADFDCVRDALFGGRVPPLPALLAADAPAPSADPALAAQLVEFWVSFPECPRRFGALCRALAGGRPWSPELFLATSIRKTDAFAADADFSAWMQRRASRILTPGETTDSFVGRTFVAMQLFPGRDGVPEGISDAPLPLERLLEPDAREWAPAAARALKAEILHRAIGRGDAFRAACDRFAAFFDEAAKPKPSLGTAIPLLREARALLDAAAEDGEAE
ncbi:MAG: hypothetical protein II839_13225 [Kiritimatiellae bacterium]|nr:hypothetical protein [Kiritimatiellia bacterium]